MRWNNEPTQQDDRMTGDSMTWQETTFIGAVSVTLAAICTVFIMSGIGALFGV
jgi:hypothetical protein